MIDWEEESVPPTQDLLVKKMIDTVGLIVLSVVAIAGLYFC